MTAKLLRMGTRGSPLARTQSAWVADRIKEANPGLEIEMVVIKTSGDRFSAEINSGEAAPPEDARAGDAPNVKAMFIKEIETELLNGSVDFGVHSTKDLPAELAPGLSLAGFPKREDPSDAYLGGRNRPRLADLGPGAVVGTASLRRRIQLERAYPGISFKAIRGNVDTRLKKLDAGEVDGIILALAGLKRLGLASVPHEAVPYEVIVPAPGQGALAIEIKEDRAGVMEFLRPVLDEDARLEVELERKFMSAVGGGCSTPLGALARIDRGSGECRMRVFWSDPDGRKPLFLSGRSGTRPEELSSLADGLIDRLRNPSHL